MSTPRITAPAPPEASFALPGCVAADESKPNRADLSQRRARGGLEPKTDEGTVISTLALSQISPLGVCVWSLPPANSACSAGEAHHQRPAQPLDLNPDMNRWHQVWKRWDGSFLTSDVLRWGMCRGQRRENGQRASAHQAMGGREQAELNVDCEKEGKGEGSGSVIRLVELVVVELVVVVVVVVVGVGVGGGVVILTSDLTLKSQDRTRNELGEKRRMPTPSPPGSLGYAPPLLLLPPVSTVLKSPSSTSCSSGELEPSRAVLERTARSPRVERGLSGESEKRAVRGERESEGALEYRSGCLSPPLLSSPGRFARRLAAVLIPSYISAKTRMNRTASFLFCVSTKQIPHRSGKSTATLPYHHKRRGTLPQHASSLFGSPVLNPPDVAPEPGWGYGGALSGTFINELYPLRQFQTPTGANNSSQLKELEPLRFNTPAGQRAAPHTLPSNLPRSLRRAVTITSPSCLCPFLVCLCFVQRGYGSAPHHHSPTSARAPSKNQTRPGDTEAEVHHRPKRGWIWNQFFVLEEHIGPEAQYVGKAQYVCSGSAILLYSASCRCSKAFGSDAKPDRHEAARPRLERCEIESQAPCLVFSPEEYPQSIQAHLPSQAIRSCGQNVVSNFGGAEPRAGVVMVTPAFLITSHGLALALNKLHSNSDKGDGSVRYILTGEGAGTIFIIDEVTGDIHATKSLDREKKTHYVLHAQAIDRHTNKPLEPESEFIIKVQDINDNAPKFPDGPFVASVPEMSEVDGTQSEQAAAIALLATVHCEPGCPASSLQVPLAFGYLQVQCQLIQSKGLELSRVLKLRCDGFCITSSPGTSVFQVTASDADDPTYGNSARVVYSILQGQPYFSVDPKTAALACTQMLHQQRAKTHIPYPRVPSQPLPLDSPSDGKPCQHTQSTDLICQIGLVENRHRCRTEALIYWPVKHIRVQRSVHVPLPRATNRHKHRRATARRSAPPARRSLISLSLAVNQNEGPTVRQQVRPGKAIGGGGQSAERTGREMSVGDALTLKEETYLKASPLNYEKKKTYTLHIEGTNTHLDPRFSYLGPFKDSATLKITVGDVDEPPVFSMDYYIMDVYENAPVGTEVGAVTARDPDSNNSPVRYFIDRSLHGDMYFNIDANTGAIKTTQALDREEVAWHNITVSASEVDNPSLLSHVNVTVQVLDVNDNPPKIAAEDEVIVCEGTKQGQVIHTVTAVDKDDFANGPHFSFALPRDLPMNPNFTLKDNEETEGQSSDRPISGDDKVQMGPLLTSHSAAFDASITKRQSPSDLILFLSAAFSMRLYNLVRTCRAEAFLSSAGLSTGALIAILLCIVILLVIVVLFITLRRSKKEPLIISEEDIRENVVTYDDEGGGEEDTEAFDIIALRNPAAAEELKFRRDVRPDRVPRGPRRSQHRGPNGGPELRQSPSLALDEVDVHDFIKRRLVEADMDTSVPPYDSLQTYAYEGQGSPTGSISSLDSATTHSEQDYTYLEDWGPEFQKLAELYK
ncbi:hypothetical protein JZ751_028634, partial [Albula glossodonta]